jgi:hypothetical protein
MAPNLIAPLVAAPLIAFAIYRRIRGTFGRQPILTRRMMFRVGVFALIACLMMLSGLQDIRLAEGALGGIVIGAALGLVGLKLTRFEMGGDGDFYVPNPWIGGALTAFLLGRLAWRFVALMPGAQASMTTPAAGNSPLTMLIAGLLIGYYIAYITGLLIHHRRYRLALSSTV